MSLLECSATAVARRLRAIVLRQHARELAKVAWPLLEGEGRVAVEPISAFLAAKKWNPIQKGAARALACEAMWTRRWGSCSG